jgi:histidinol-phosphate aminotransferase
MSIVKRARAEIVALQPYSSARLEAGVAHTMLNANEAPGSPILDDTLALNRYPEPQPKALLAALASLYGVAPAQVFVGRGSDEPIDLLVRAFCRAGEDNIVICPPTFGMYAVAAGVQNAGILRVPLKIEADVCALDFSALREALTANTKIVFLCTPNNPTGSLLPQTDILRFVSDVCDHVLVVVDEAYIEFSHDSSLAKYLDQHNNLAILRTLSKAQGLAGVRCGALLAWPEIISLLRKIMAPYPIAAPVQDAVLKALANPAWTQQRIAQCIAERQRIQTALGQLKNVTQVWPSQANFVCFQVSGAADIYRGLLQRGIIIRDVSHYLGLAQCLRVSVGLPQENDRFLDALTALSLEHAA